jgi:hypothetical protein
MEDPEVAAAIRVMTVVAGLMVRFATGEDMS